MQKLLSKRERLILYGTLALIAFGLMSNFLILPLIRGYRAVAQEISVSEARLRKYTALLSRKDYLKRSYQGIAQPAAADKNKDTLVALLSELETTAKESNILIFDIRPQPPSSTLRPNEILIELSAQGNLEDYVRFMYNVENSLSLLKFERFRLTSLPNTSALEGNFTISKLSLSD